MDERLIEYLTDEIEAFFQNERDNQIEDYDEARRVLQLILDVLKDRIDPEDLYDDEVDDDDWDDDYEDDGASECY